MQIERFHIKMWLSHWIWKVEVEATIDWSWVKASEGQTVSSFPRSPPLAMVLLPDVSSSAHSFFWRKKPRNLQVRPWAIQKWHAHRRKSDRQHGVQSCGVFWTIAGMYRVVSSQVPARRKGPDPTNWLQVATSPSKFQSLRNWTSLWVFHGVWTEEHFYYFKDAKPLSCFP